MTTPFRILMTLGACLCLQTSPVAAAQPAGSVDPLLHTCAACHGQYGQKTAPGQSQIGSRDFFELLAAMASYRTTQRIHPAMSMLMLSLDEVQMAEIAEYYARVDPARLQPAGPYGMR